MDYDRILGKSLELRLDIFGGLVTGPGDGVPEGCRTLLLLGPAEPGFWQTFTASAEYGDGAPHARDRWSTRVIGKRAREFGCQALFPVGGPPQLPFIEWARRTGRAWRSPAGMLLHDGSGLMASYRGALAFRERIELPETGARPCDTCSGRPCLSACPVSALNARTGYDIAACHGFLDTVDGVDCMSRGCAARRACPVSAGYGRLEGQSAFHMKAFHP